jgi:uncharacterized protein YjiS (DUF1127 family)
MLETRISYETALRPAALPRPGRLVALVHRLLEWHERMQQRRHLGGLSTHMLKDIGLTSADVYAETGKRPWQL